LWYTSLPYSPNWWGCPQCTQSWAMDRRRTIHLFEFFFVEIWRLHFILYVKYGELGTFFPQKSLVRVKIINFRLEKMENSLPHLPPRYLISMPWSLEKIVQFQELHLYVWAIHLSDFFQL